MVAVGYALQIAAETFKLAALMVGVVWRMKHAISAF